MMDANQRGVVPNRSRQGAVCVVWLLLCLSAGFVKEAAAFSTTLKYSTEDQGRREILSFRLPPGAGRPHFKLVGFQMLRVTVPGILALPANVLDTERSRWIASFQVEEIPSGELGLNLLIGLKKPNLSFRDSLGEADPVMGALYHLEIDRQMLPTDTKETRVMEGRILAGRDGTLVVLSRTGTAPVETSIELESRVVRLFWKDATLDPGWRTVPAEGLAERLLAYDFSHGRVEMELLVHRDVTRVDFHQDPASGLFIIELAGNVHMGRSEDAEALLDYRRGVLESGEAHPLNRLDPIFIPRYDITLELQGRVVDETYFMKAAKDAARDRKYALARSYLDKLLERFPGTPNREIIDVYAWDLANSMNWKPGWLLAELNKILAKYPNMLLYPRYRLHQLSLLNRVSRFEDAAAILWDPNLPKNDAKVWLERAYTAMGLARSGVEEDTNWEKAEEYLRRILALSNNKGDISAEAHYLLARMAQDLYETDERSAVAIIDGLSSDQRARIANRPEWLMAVGDIYYENNLYPKAFKYYSQFMSNYPNMEAITPWVILRAAESSQQMGRIRDARRLFASLQKNFPNSDSAAWGRVFELGLDMPEDVSQRLANLDAVIKTIAIPEVLSETLRVKATLQGDAHRYQDALRTLNNLLSLTSRTRVVRHANKLKRAYLIAGMQQALDQGRPEHAILLAEQHGDDWRNRPGFVLAQVALAEALLRIGLYDKALAFLEGVSAPAVPGLTRLAKAFSEKRWPEVTLPPVLAALPAASLRGRRATEEALSAMGEGEPSVEDGIPSREERLFVPAGMPASEEAGRPMPGSVTVAEARVRLDEAARLVTEASWKAVLDLLEQLPASLLNEPSQAKRLLLMATAEAGRKRYPQAVRYLETLFSGQSMGDGSQYYWYGTLLQDWKGDDKALPAFERVTAEAEDKEIQALAHVRIGDIMQRSGGFAVAIEHYQEASRLAPGTPWAKVSTENAAQLQMAMEVAQ